MPFVLWLALREHRGRVLEYATVALWLVLAVCVMAGMLGGRYFSLSGRYRRGPAFPFPDR